MWIRMISTAAGPRLPHCLLAGTVYQLDDELGRELVEAKAAAEVADPRAKKPKAEKSVETAAIDDGEKATQPGAEKKPESLIDKLTKAPASAPEEKSAKAPAGAPEEKPAKATAKNQ